MKAELKECRLIEDGGGHMWLDVNQLFRAGYADPKQIEIVEVGGEEFLEVLGYSEKRKALWVKLIDFEGAAENIEEEIERYGEQLRDSDAGEERASND